MICRISVLVRHGYHKVRIGLLRMNVSLWSVHFCNVGVLEGNGEKKWESENGVDAQ